MKVKSESEAPQSCPTLSDPMDCSLPGSSHGIFQAKVLEWVAIAFSKVKEHSSRRQKRAAKQAKEQMENSGISKSGRSDVVTCVVTQSCPTLCDPMDCNLQGSSVHGIF